MDFSGKAERRGVQRAAIELALNLLATNQEQHRPHDRFRRVQLPPEYQPLPKEVPLWKPLELWKRPVELDPFHFTKLMLKLREWKDHDYGTARQRVINENPGQLQAPANYNGPHVLATHHELQELARRRHNHLLQIHTRLLQTLETAPRPLLERICMLMGEAIALPSTSSHQLRDDTLLTMGDLDVLLQLSEPSWNLERKPYDENISGFPSHEPDLSIEKARLEEFERDVESSTDPEDLRSRPLLPFWQPYSLLRARRAVDPNATGLFTQHPYDGGVSSEPGVLLPELVQTINNDRGHRAQAYGANVHMWSRAEAAKYLEVMHDFGRIQSVA